jgi:hypothetical protein
MIKCVKAAMLSVILVVAAPVAAYAADPTPPQTQTRSELATYPGSAYSSTQMPDPIQSNPSADFDRTEGGSFYSKKGFSPSPHSENLGQ